MCLLSIVITDAHSQSGIYQGKKASGKKEKLNMFGFNSFDLVYGNITFSYERLTKWRNQTPRQWGIRIPFSYGMVDTYDGQTYSGLPRSESKMYSGGLDVNAYFISMEQFKLFFGCAFDWGLFKYDDFEEGRLKVSEPEALQVRYFSAVCNLGIMLRTNNLYCSFVSGLGLLGDMEEDYGQYSGYGDSGDFYKGKYDDKTIYNIELNVGFQF